MKRIIIKIEREIFFWTGIIMPSLKREWARNAREIQRELDMESLLYDKVSRFSLEQDRFYALGNARRYPY